LATPRLAPRGTFGHPYGQTATSFFFFFFFFFIIFYFLRFKILKINILIKQNGAFWVSKRPLDKKVMAKILL
jgi:hypothetical protein